MARFWVSTSRNHQNTLSNHSFHFGSRSFVCGWWICCKVSAHRKEKSNWSSPHNLAKIKKKYSIISTMSTVISHYESIFISCWLLMWFFRFCFYHRTKSMTVSAGKCEHPNGECERVCVLFHPFLIVFTFVMTRIKCPCAMFGLVSRISRTVVHTYGKLCVIGVLNTNTNDINSFHRWTNMY